MSIQYLMSGAAHLPYLVVSLHSLRKHYQGQVTVNCWDDSLSIAQNIGRDHRLGVTVRQRVPMYRGKNDQFLDKILLMQSPAVECDVNLYLDADTMINGSLEPLLEAARRFGFCATQFCDWTTQNGIIKKRINGLREFNSIPQVYISMAVDIHNPSVNGGVFACRCSSPVLTKWYDWAWAARNIFIADETVLHLMPQLFTPDKFEILTGGSWNCSPKYKPPGLADADVKIWHFHGDSNVRPDKSQKGFDLWWPVFEECLKENIGGMADWIDQINNKWIRKLYEANGNRSS